MDTVASTLIVLRAAVTGMIICLIIVTAWTVCWLESIGIINRPSCISAPAHQWWSSVFILGLNSTHFNWLDTSPQPVISGEGIWGKRRRLDFKAQRYSADTNTVVQQWWCCYLYTKINSLLWAILCSWEQNTETRGLEFIQIGRWANIHQNGLCNISVFMPLIFIIFAVSTSARYRYCQLVSCNSENTLCYHLLSYSTAATEQHLFISRREASRPLLAVQTMDGLICQWNNYFKHLINWELW